ncbi:hypothetical protein HQN88_09995 [Paenibacillus qinlingensis]|nr:hypothetical protein [Paenibacillus qinlingensis]
MMQTDIKGELLINESSEPTSTASDICFQYGFIRIRNSNKENKSMGTK